MALPRRELKFIDSRVMDDQFSVRSEGQMVVDFEDELRWGRDEIFARLRAACERRGVPPGPVIDAVRDYLDERHEKIPVRALGEAVGISRQKAGRILREAWPERNMGE